jgi:hypothetical protein
MKQQTILQDTKKQITLFNTYNYASYENIIQQYSKEFRNLIKPKGDTCFGFWMQTLADLELLDLELKGLTKSYYIDPINKIVDFEGDDDYVRNRVAHLELVRNKPSLYCEFVDNFDDTNAYAFHNLYPYKGKFYPRIVRTLINAFKLDSISLILDPFNGSGTTTHEASLMGIPSIGIDITPIGVMIAELKNELLFLNEKDLDFSYSDLTEILNAIENKKWEHKNTTIYKLMLIIYFDTVDAFQRTSRYEKKGKIGLFVEKFQYIRECYKKIKKIQENNKLYFTKAQIIEGDVLDLKNLINYEKKFDACITSPPYYFSIDYVGKDKIAYEYLNLDPKEIEKKYLGMKENNLKNLDSSLSYLSGFPSKIIRYYLDLKIAIENIYWALKSGGKLAIIVGDSTVDGKKIPTTIMTKMFCEEVGFKFEKLIFNPLLGVRNRAIRGESIIICTKP